MRLDFLHAQKDVWSDFNNATNLARTKHSSISSSQIANSHSAISSVNRLSLSLVMGKHPLCFGDADIVLLVGRSLVVGSWTDDIDDWKNAIWTFSIGCFIRSTDGCV